MARDYKKEYSEKLRDPRWQKKRLEILNRDHFTCKYCGDTESELQVHHLKYKNNPWDVDSEFLETACIHCHDAIEGIKRQNDQLIVYKIKKQPYTDSGDGAKCFQLIALTCGLSKKRSLVVLNWHPQSINYGLSGFLVDIKELITEFEKFPIQYAENQDNKASACS